MFVPKPRKPLPNPLLKPLPKLVKVGLNMLKKGAVGSVGTVVEVGNPKKPPSVLETFWKVLLNAEFTAGKKSVALVVGTPASAENRLVKVVPVPPVPMPVPVPVPVAGAVPVPVPVRTRARDGIEEDPGEGRGDVRPGAGEQAGYWGRR